MMLGSSQLYVDMYLVSRISRATLVEHTMNAAVVHTWKIEPASGACTCPSVLLTLIVCGVAPTAIQSSVLLLFQIDEHVVITANKYDFK